MNDAQRRLLIARFLIRPIRRQRVECIGDRDDARQQRNVVSLQAVRIAPAIERFVMQLNSRNHVF